MTGAELFVGNEFGAAWLSVDWSGNGPRLLIRSREGEAIFLDPLVLESLTRWTHAELIPLLMTSEYK